MGSLAGHIVLSASWRRPSVTYSWRSIEARRKVIVIRRLLFEASEVISKGEVSVNCGRSQILMELKVVMCCCSLSCDLGLQHWKLKGSGSRRRPTTQHTYKLSPEPSNACPRGYQTTCCRICCVQMFTMSLQRPNGCDTQVYSSHILLNCTHDEATSSIST